MKDFREAEADPCAVAGPGRDLLPVAEAIERATALARSVTDTETVALDEAIGRVLAKDLTAPLSLPPFDNSAMDGYALRSSDLTGPGPWRLHVASRIAAGDDAGRAGPLGPGQAARIFTGAPVPAGADAVVMQEHVRREGDSIVLDRPVACGDCIRRAGEDARRGDVLLAAGALIGAREIGAIASVGLPQVTVRRKIRVALFCTGSELRQPGEALGPGQIYNSNRFILMAALRQPWIELFDHGAIEDDPARLRAALARIAPRVDMIVTTGGVSVGEEDHMVAQLRAAGGRIGVMRIAMKPGKPLSVGTLGPAVFVGLPGNPVAAFTTWKVIGSQVARKLAGLRPITAGDTHVELATGFDRRPGRQEYRPARIIGLSPEGRPRIELLGQNYSARISLVCQSDGLAILPAHSARFQGGDRVEFLRL